MRVILDTNVLLSGLITPGGIPARLINAWLDHRFTLVSHPIQLGELRTVSRRDKVKADPPVRSGPLGQSDRRAADLPERLLPVERSRDPRDDFLLALCEGGKADWLVTDDKNDLLALQRHASARTVSATSFAAET